MELLGNIILDNFSNQKCNGVMGYCVGGSDCSSLMDEYDEYLHDSDERKKFVVLLNAVAFVFDPIFIFLLFQQELFFFCFFFDCLGLS